MTRTIGVGVLLSLSMVSTAWAQSQLVVLEGLVRHDPLRVVTIEGTVKGTEIEKGLHAILQRPELEYEDVSIRLERGRLVAIEAVARGDIALLSSPALGAERKALIKANSTLLVVGSKMVDGQHWLRAFTNDKKVGAVSFDQVELIPQGGVGSFLGRQLAPLLAHTTRKRQARTFHPDGHVYQATVTSLLPAYFSKTADALAGQALIRLGGGIQKLAADGNEKDGTDGLSMAIRFTENGHVLDTKTRPGDQDLLLTAWAERFEHLVTRTPFGDPHDFFNNHYFPGVPYEIAGQPVWLRLIPKAPIKRHLSKGLFWNAIRSDAERSGRNRIPDLEAKVKKDEARFILQVQKGNWWRISRPWIGLVEITLTKQLPKIDQNALHYHPTLEGAGLKPVGFITNVRKAVYRASQDEREKMGVKQRLEQTGRE